MMPGDTVETIRRAVDIALVKPAPERIPLNGEARLASRDYFSVVIQNDELRNAMLVQRREGDNLCGNWFNYDTRNLNDHEDSVPLADLVSSDESGFSLTITAYFREIEVRYETAGCFLRDQTWKFMFFRLGWARLKQWWWARQKLPTSGQMEVLEALVQARFESEQELVRARPVPISEIIVRLHNRNWAVSRESSSAYGRYNFILDSLVDSGDASNREQSYWANPRALTTLTAHRRDERRHRDNILHQRGLLFLTFALVATGVVGIFIEIL